MLAVPTASAIHERRGIVTGAEVVITRRTVPADRAASVARCDLGACGYAAGVVSLYQLQQMIYDQLGRWGSDRDDLVDIGAYELTADEAAAFEASDVGSLYALGVHPVLLNSLCRGLGFTRDDYRKMLEPYGVSETKVPRWRVSS
jgi:hypothetical protein